MQTATKGGCALALLAVWCLAAPVLAQQGVVREGLTIESTVLGGPVRYTVYLPPDYDTSTRAYPVVYLLHGYTDDDTGWLQFGEVNRIADAAIASGQVPPMVIVMPDGGVSWYVNDHAGRVRWEDMFLQELIPHVEQTYRVRPKREYRGIAGLSMGGYGALRMAMAHPDRFAAVAAFSSGITAEEDFAAMPQARYDGVFGPVFGPGLQGRARITDHWRRHSVLDLVADTPVDALKRVRYYLDSGDDDFLAVGNALLHVALRRKEVPHEFRVRDGAHTWTYWRTGLADGLAFIGQSFRR